MRNTNNRKSGRRHLNRIRRIAPAIAAAGAAFATIHPAMAASGTWSFLGSGSWSTASNWASGNVADGASNIADFSKLNITADTTVSLDSPRSIGQLLFADTTQSNNWALDNGGNAANILTLNNGASQPVITIGNTTTTGQITTISAVLAGTNGFIKNGPGALQLTGANTFTGQITLNSGTSGTGADLILGNNSALGASTNTLFIDPGSSNLARVRLNAGVVISNPITLHTVRAPLQNGVLQTNGNVSASLTGPITIDNVVGSGGDFSGPNDATLTNFLTISGPITISNLYPAGNLTNANNNGVIIRTGNVILSGGGSYFRIEQRTGELRLGANNGIATNAYIDLGVNNGNPTTSFNATVDLFGFNQTMVGVENLSQNGTVTNSANAPSTLTLTPGIAASAPTPPNLVFAGSFMSDNQATLSNSLLSVVINGSPTGMQTFNNAGSSYHGSTSILSGILAVNTLANGGANSSIGASTSGAANLVLGGGTLRYTGVSVSTDRNFTLNTSTTSTMDVSTAATTLTMSGAGTGGGGLTKAGAGTLLFSGIHTYTGNTTVSAGALIVNGSLAASSNVSVAAGATLGGTGTVGGTVTPASGGIISPGSSIGTFTVGGLTLSTGAQVNFEFDGVNNDQVTVSNSGGLTLNGGNLFLYNNGAASSYTTNGTYTLFNINGGFGGSLDNLTVSNPFAGKFYNITSTASAINLTIGDATTVGWTDNNSTDLWTDAGNWAGGVIPNAVGQTASFGDIAGSGSVNMNGSKTVSGLVFNSSFVNYDIFGSGALTIDNGSAAGAITVSAGTHAIDVPITLNGAVSVMTTNPGDSLSVNGNISGAFPITVTGPGALTLAGANSFTTFSVNGSTVNVGNGGAGGSLGTGPVTLSNNAILNFNTSANYNFGQSITGSGTLNQIGSGTTTVGAVNVTAVNVSNGALITSSINQTSGINVTGSGRLAANGTISGAGSLVVNTSGAVSLGASNTYTGRTEIDAGTVTLNAIGALPANSALAVNGGTLDLNAKSISISNILDSGATGGVITNHGANGTTSTVTFTGNAANYNLYAALNDGASGGKVALVSTINNVNLGAFSLALHASSTYSGGTTVTRQSIDAYATNALGSGSVVLLANTASTNVTHLGVAGGISLPNNITIALPNAGGADGAIQYLTTTTGSSMLTGAITVQADNFTGGTFAGPSNGVDVLNINGPVTTTGATTAISLISGRVGFGGGGSYPQLNVFNIPEINSPGAALLNAPNGIATNAVVNFFGGALDLLGNNQTLAGLSGGAGGNGHVTNSSGTSATLTLNVAANQTFAATIDGNLNLTKSGAATQTFTGPGNYTGNTTVQNGALTLVGAGAWTPVLNNSNVSASTDIQGGRLVFDYTGGSSPGTTILAILTSSYASGFASGQIHSSTATSSIGLGWIDDAGQSKVTIARAYYGDANLDGSVDTVDFNILASNFSHAGVWAQADFNYDGTVDTVDFNLLASNFSRTLAAPQAASAAGLGALVPEPASAGFIGALAGGALLARRRRR